MNNRVVLIIDDNEQYLSSRVREIIKEWNLSSSDYKTVTKWSIGLANVKSLFGSPKIIHLDLSNKNDFKYFSETYKSDKKFKDSFDKEDWFGPGVIITTTVAKGVKFIETLVTKAKGEITKKRNPQEIKEELLSKISISNNLKSFLSDYAGDDYEILLNSVNGISRLPEEEIKKITLEDLIVYLPVKKGAIPPWEITKSMMKYDTKTTLENLRRCLENQHSLVIITFLRRKIEELYHDRILKDYGIVNVSDRADIIGVNQWALKYNPTNISREVLESLVRLIYNAEDSLKGGATIVDTNIFMESLVTKIIIAMKHNIKV